MTPLLLKSNRFLMLMLFDTINSKPSKPPLHFGWPCDSRHDQFLSSQAQETVKIQHKPVDFSRRKSSQSAPVTPAQTSYNELASAFYVINSKYRITWECADLLIELGAGSTKWEYSNDDLTSPHASNSAPIASHHFLCAWAWGGEQQVQNAGEKGLSLLQVMNQCQLNPHSLSYSVPGVD
jgi:hypothetical protein